MEAIGQKSSSRVKSDINVIPLIDIMLVLLIIFMASSSFVTDSQPKVKLPDAMSASPESEKNIIVTIDADGKFYMSYELEGRPVSDPMEAGELLEAIQAKVDQLGALLIVLKADKVVQYEKIMMVIDAIKMVGANVALATVIANPT